MPMLVGMGLAASAGLLCVPGGEEPPDTLGERPTVIEHAANEAPPSCLDPQPDDRIGQLLRETFRIERLIASGGMGAVYEASHLRLEQRFAIKFLERDLARDPDVYARFRQEAEIAAQLNHRNVVQVFDFDADASGTPFMVMELVAGETLADWLDRRSRFDKDDIVAIFEPLCRALEACHRHEIVHRDLKPSNIMVHEVPGERGGRHQFEVKLLDFGISKIKHDPEVTAMTRDNVVMGTPNYMCPQQAQGQNKDIDARSDVFALGAILYEAIAGRRAFQSANLPQLLHSIVYVDPEMPRRAPTAVRTVLQTALAKDPQVRYANAGEFLVALLDAWGPTVAHAEPPADAPRAGPGPSSPRVGASVRGRLLSAALVALGATVAAGVGGYGFGLATSPRKVEAAIPKPTPEPSPVHRHEESPAVPTWPPDLATAESHMLERHGQLYRADRLGLTVWRDPGAAPRTRALPSAAAVSSLSTTLDGSSVLVGQADGRVSRYDDQLEEVWSRRLGQTAISSLALGRGYLVVGRDEGIDLYNEENGRRLQRFRIAETPLATMVLQSKSNLVLVVRPGALDLIDADARRVIDTVAAFPVGQGLLKTEVLDEGPAAPAFAIEAVQGEWWVRREYEVRWPKGAAGPVVRQRSQARISSPVLENPHPL